MSANKLLRVPQRLPTREMLIGTLHKLENVQNIVVIVEDEAGIWIMQEADVTLERINWMFDRAKKMLHE
jgi:2-phospho-L-lactate guanylyltransferase (CobY/MobA/RfbA family)